MKDEELPSREFGWDCFGLAVVILAVSLSYCGCAIGERIRTDGFPWSPAKEVKK